MPTFLVEGHLLAVEKSDLMDAQRAVVQACARLTSQGRAVRCLDAIYVAEDGRYLRLFEAVDEATVQRVNEVTQLPFERILDVLRLDVPLRSE